MLQELFTLSFWVHAFFAFLGAGLLYMQWGRTKLKIFAFSDFLDTIDMSEKVRIRFEMIVFMVIGTVVAIGLTSPSTAPQAFSAGLGWTGLAAKPSLSGSKRQRGHD